MWINGNESWFASNCTSNFELTFDLYCVRYWAWNCVIPMLPDETNYNWREPRHGLTMSCSYDVSGADITTTYFPRNYWVPVKITFKDRLWSVYINGNLVAQATLNYDNMDRLQIMGEGYYSNIKLQYS